MPPFSAGRRLGRLRLETLEQRLTPTAGPNIWQGPEGGVWSDAANWSLNHAPQAGDHLVFNETNSNNSIADLTTTVASVRMDGYSGTIEQSSGRSLTVSSHFSLYSGVWILGGSLTVDDGSFFANSSNIFVTGTGIFGGSGDVNGNLSVNSGGTLSPGNDSIGSIDVFGFVEFQEDGNFLVEFGTGNPGESHDRITAFYTSMQPAVTLNLVARDGYTPTGGEVFTIVSRSEGSEDTFQDLPDESTLDNFLDSGLDAHLSYFAGDFEADIQITVDDAPVVSISATKPTANENDTADNTLVITLTRTGDLTDPLTVQLTQAGSLMFEDLATHSSIQGGTRGNGTVTFDAGSDTITLTFQAVNDIHAEASESATVTIAPGQGYRADHGSNEATVIITANDFVVINTNSSGEGSLAQAVENAEEFCTADTITFEGAVFTDSTPDVIYQHCTFIFEDSHTTTIAGPGANRLTIVASPDGFASNYDGRVVIQGLKLTAEETLEDDLIYNEAWMTLDGVWVDGVTAAGEAFAVHNDYQLLIRNSTFSNITIEDFGYAAIVNHYGLEMVNVTISGNTSSGSSAGVYQSGHKAYATLTHVTITKNQIIHESQSQEVNSFTSGVESAAGLRIAGGTVLVVNSIISGNLEDGEASDITGAGNLTARSSLLGSRDTDLGGDSEKNILSTTPGLAPLTNNGGTTPTHLLLPISPARNRGDNSLVPEGLTTDQRGLARVVGQVDMGATELATGFRVAPKRYVGRVGRPLVVGKGQGLLTGLKLYPSQPTQVQIVRGVPSVLGTLTVAADGSFTFRPLFRVPQVRFVVRVFNGQEWSEPFQVTLVFRQPGRRR